MGDLQKEFAEDVPGIYRLIKPADALPLIFDSPHSGTVYPDDFHYACAFQELEKAEDKYVDELFAAAPDYGAALLCADFPRSYIDVNRCATDIDVELLSDAWDGEIAAAGRSHAGIGLIRRLVRPGLPVYDRALSALEIQDRIKRCYLPYHSVLKNLIERAHYDYGQAWHINCHSMPSLDVGNRNTMSRSIDFVLGDRDGTTCDPSFTRNVRDFLAGLGFKVAINDPYKGVELVRRYSSPARGLYSLQIEIARSLYLDENTYEKRKDFDSFKSNIDNFIAFLSNYIKSQFYQIAAD